MAGVALAGNVEGSLFILRVLVHEIVEERGKVGCDGVFRPAKHPKTVNEAEACSKGLVNVHNIRVVIPGVIIHFELERIFDVFTFKLKVKRAIFRVESEHRRAPRTTLKPDDQRVVGWVIPRLN